MQFVPLSREFYNPSAEVVAPLLLGHWLVRNTPEGFCGGPIVETEAYLKNDAACHAARGETKRNRTMWGAPGHSYVYLIYGLHYCVNAVCHPAGSAEAVLIRAIEPAIGETFMRSQRPVAQLQNLTSGPAKLCSALNIGREIDGVDLCDSQSPLFIAENPTVERTKLNLGPLIQTTRIGITKAAELPMRFYLDKSLFVSKRL